MDIRIRPFCESDILAIVEILKLNNQYGFPEVDGPEAIQRASRYENVASYVALSDEMVLGMVRGVWDGSRALIHQISVHPRFRRSGIGRLLLRKIACKFKEMGASTVSITVSERNENAIEFFRKSGFEDVGVKLLVASDIDEVGGD